MNDYFLKASDEASLLSALESAGLVQTIEDQRVPVGIALDIIGTILTQTGVDAEGQPIMEPVEGYHANIRGELAGEQIAALPTVPVPLTPFRTWA